MYGKWRIGVLLVLIWIVAGGVILWTRAVRPTPESLMRYVQEHPLEGLSPESRSEIIHQLARRLNRLDFEQRQQLRGRGSDRDLFKQMTPEEQKLFIDLTLPEGFHQLMLALNKMAPEKRKKVVQRALDGMENDQPGLGDRVDREHVQKVISQGMDSFYQDASAEVKLDFAPVIEELQRVTRSR